MPVFQSDNNSLHVPGQLVVALSHRGLVITKLKELGVHDQELSVVAESPALDLALIEIKNIEQVAGRIDDPSPPTVNVIAAELATQKVLTKLESRCAEDFGGWAPEMSKNQGGEGVQGTPDIGIGGAGLAASREPQPLRGPAPPPLNLTPTTVQVGILDTSMVHHPELAGAYLDLTGEAVLNVSTLSDLPRFFAGHAQFIAGLILRRAPNSRLRVSSVLDNNTAKASVWDVANAIVGFAASDVSILNLSFCSFSADGKAPFALARALERLDPEIVVVAAAGNHGDITTRSNGLGPKSPAWPAAFDRVIAVGAHDNRQPADFSPKLPWVRLMAPGKDVTSTYLNGKVQLPASDINSAPKIDEFDGYATWSGTSFAAAAVSGALAGRVRPGKSAQDALHELMTLAVGNDEGIWPYRQV